MTERMSEKEVALFWAGIFEKRQRQPDGTMKLKDVDALVVKALRFYATKGTPDAK